MENPEPPSPPVPTPADVFRRGATGGEKTNGPLAGAVEPGLLDPAGYALSVGTATPNDKHNAQIRVAAYIDGFNLYRGLTSKWGRQYAWLDLQAFCSSLLKPGQELVLVRYFTAVVSDQGAARRQNIYLDALGAHCPSVNVVRGRMQFGEVWCSVCGTDTPAPKEKETDVGIAISMVDDMHRNRFDEALVVSGDTDLLPPIRLVAGYGRNVTVVFPPNREHVSMRQAATAVLNVKVKHVRDNQLPDPVMGPKGITLQRPAKWN